MSKLKNVCSASWLTRIILIVMLLLGVGGAYLGYSIVSRMVAGTTAIALPGDPVLPQVEATDVQAVSQESTPKPTSPPAASLPAPDPWDGTSRVNVLIMGLDLRDVEMDNAPRSDTMILLSLDPLNNTAAAIAIPRDMWVAVPGFGYYKINTAFRFGELYNLPGGGPELASRTVEEFLGVPVHFYTQIDFQAFVDFIDHIDGIKITLNEPFTIDRRGKWNTVTLEPGTYVFNGEYALAYARNRSTAGDDFDRSARQEEVILAIRQRILEFDQLPHLVVNAPQIYEDLEAGIRTNMSLEQVIKLAWKASEIPEEHINTVVIGPSYVTIETSPDGLAILKPIPDKIRLLRDEVLGGGGAIGPMAEGDLMALIAAESASISLQNGSSMPGLAETTSLWLQEKGFKVVQIGDAAYAPVTKIEIYAGKPYTISWLVETFGLTAGAIRHTFSPESLFDLVLILGDDWAASNPIP